MRKMILIGVAVLTVTPKEGWTPVQVVESEDLEVQGILKNLKAHLDDLYVTQFISGYGETVIGAQVSATLVAEDKAKLDSILKGIKLSITSPLGKVKLDRWASWSVEDSK